MMNHISSKNPTDSKVGVCVGVCLQTIRTAWIPMVALLSIYILPATLFPQTLPAPQSHVLEFIDIDYAAAPQSPLLDLGNQFTMETWVYLPRSPTPYGVIMGKVNISSTGNDPNKHYVLETLELGQLDFIQTTGQPGSYRSISASSPLPLQQWVHVAATLSSGTMRLYINGQEVATGASPGTPAGTDAPFALGGGAEFGLRNCCWLQSGYLRQARVWNRALTQSEIANNMSVRLNGNEAGLAAQWMLDDTEGQIARDSSVNNLHLRLGRTPDIDSGDPRPARTIIADRAPFFRLEEFSIQPNPAYNISGVRLIDFDSDGDLDFLDFRHGIPFAGPSFAVRNNGLGVFTDATAAVLGTQNIQTITSPDFVVADLNGDGRKDIFVADLGPDGLPALGGQSRLLLQTADGRLLDRTNTNLPIKNAFTHRLASADIDHDGDVDIYLSNICCGGGPELYINNGQGIFTANTSRLPAFITNGDRKYTTSLFMDVNDDNHPDLILGAHGGSFPSQGGLRDTILLNDGSGNFTEATPTVLPPRGGGPTWGGIDIQKADFDNDGKTDLLLSLADAGQHRARFQLLINNGDGTFRDGTKGNLPQPIQATLPLDDGVPWVLPADFNNDGKIDFVTSTITYHSQLYLNLGNARFEDFTELLPFSVAMPTALPGDLDGDGDMDILNMGSDGNYKMLRNLKPFIVSAVVSGRVATPTGLGLRNAVVTLIDSKGVRRTATTSSFGIYTFNDVRAGGTFIISVSSKRYRFAPRSVSVSENLTDIDFVGLE